MSLKDKLADMEHGLVQERFQYLLRAIVTTMCANNTLSINEYEDLARQLLGNDAFLLFQMDKLIAVCLKQLHNFAGDTSSVMALKQFEDCASSSESSYLMAFYKAASQQEIASPSTLTGAAAANRDSVNPPLM